MKKIILTLIWLAALVSVQAQLTVTTVTNTAHVWQRATNLVTVAVVTNQPVTITTTRQVCAPIFITGDQFNQIVAGIATPPPYGLGITSSVPLSSSNLSAIYVSSVTTNGVSGYLVRPILK